jgi:hypothetical protein
MSHGIVSKIGVSGFFCLALLMAEVASARVQIPQQEAWARQVVALANQSRAEAGLPALQWDAALAGAAYDHALRMAAEGQIAHRYGGEPDLATRAAAAGARFSMIEENVAVGSSPAQIHDGWMHSQGHHDNLMNPRIDHIGVALVPSRGVLYAVADYEQSVQALTQEQIESKVATLLMVRGIALVADPVSLSAARRYCALDAGMPSAGTGPRARFLMRWQSESIAKLPQQLEDRIAQGELRQAAVGACDAKTDGNSATPVFAAYRIAVLLY